jgi:alpha-beta hydrolase superfamily lysophospholipase
MSGKVMTMNERKDFSFTSGGGLETTCYPHSGRATGIFQTSHSVGESLVRYQSFGGVMRAAELEVCGNDYRGHGCTAKDRKQLGDFRHRMLKRG